MDRLSRRRFVTLGVLATATGLAGCTDGGDGDDGDGGAGDVEDGDAGDAGDGAGDGEDGGAGDTGNETEDGDAGAGNETDDGGAGAGNETGDGGDGAAGGDGQSRLDSFLSENEANLYEGSVEDMTGQDEVTVSVGAGPDGIAFDPPAISIDSGTTVVWEWTGEGGGHNVVPTGETDFEEFGESEIISEEGHTVEATFEESGVGLYVCEPHEGLGMYGGFVVQ